MKIKIGLFLILLFQVNYSYSQDACDNAREFVANLKVEVEGGKTKTFEVYVHGNDVLMGGDIVIGKYDELFNEKKGLVSRGRTDPTSSTLWINGNVPYILDGNISSQKRNEILEAMNHIESQTNVCFKNKEADNSDYVRIRICNRNSTFPGRVGGEQVLKITASSDVPTIIHELLHVVGLLHEHERPDYEEFLNVDSDQVGDWCFTVNPIYDYEYVGSYDYYSIMHYLPFQCGGGSDPNNPPFSPKQDLGDYLIGSTDVMSPGDVASVNSLYPDPCHPQVEAPIPNFVCRGCEVDLSPVCSSLNVTSNSNSITINQFVIENLQSADAVNFSVGYYLSTTNNLSSGTPIGFQNIDMISGNSGYYIDDISFPIPSSISANYYYVIAVVDLPNSTGDINMNNNVCYGYGPIYVGGTVSCNDGIQNQGEFGVDCGGPCSACSPQVNLVSQTCAVPLANNNQLDILYDITNFGSSASGAFNVSFYAYKRFDPNPTALNINTTHSIPGNTSRNFRKTLDLSAVMTSVGLGAGDYKIGMWIDDFQAIQETNENDNWCSLNNYFTYVTHNLAHSESCLNSYVSGEYLNVVFDVVNEGNTSTGIVNYQCYISDVSNGNTYPIGDTYSIFNIAANSLYSEHISYHLETEMSAHGLFPGEYAVGIFIDNSGIIQESNENDNFCIGSSSFNYAGGCSMLDGYVEGAFSGQAEFSAANYIKSPNVGNQCIIANGGQVVMQAGGSVDLLPGFVADLGSSFTAVIDDCTNSNLIDDVVEVRETMQLNTMQELDGQSVEKSKLALKDFKISPNPFVDKTIISYDLQESENVTVFVSDINGRIIQVLLDKAHQEAGHYDLDYQNEALSNGSYLVTIQYSGGLTSKKMVVLK